MREISDVNLVQTQSEIFGTVFLLAQYLSKRGDEALAPLDVTTKQWLLLAILAKRFPNQSPTLSEASLWYGSSHQNVKKIAQQLEQKGFLRLLPDPKDRRILRLHLTPRISEFENPAELDRQAKLLGDIFSIFEPEDLAKMQSLLQQWVSCLAPAPLVRS